MPDPTNNCFVHPTTELDENVTIGKYAFAGAGSVVTKDVPDHALVMGNPARRTGWICECGEKLDQMFICPVCKKYYSLSKCDC